MIDLLLRLTYTGLLRMVSRLQRDTLRKRLLIAALMQLARWRIARLARLVAHLQTLVTQLKVKDQAAKKWEKSLE
jgi:hypothetical protein